MSASNGPWPAGHSTDEWLTRTDQIRSQQQRQRGWKLYSFHAGGRVHRQGQGRGPLRIRHQSLKSSPPMPAPRGASWSCTPRPRRAIPTTAIPRGAVIEDTRNLTGCEIEPAYADKGHRGHDAANPRHVFISVQNYGVAVHSMDMARERSLS